jgi:hypothetical protein
MVADEILQTPALTPLFALCIILNERRLGFPMVCEDRSRLADELAAAIVRNEAATKALDGMKNVESSETKKRTRAACRKALADLNEHKRVHGCGV